MRHRIYSELIQLSHSQPGVEEAKVTRPPTHAELAARVGTHREAVTREFKRLERDGLIERRRGAIVLLKPSELTARIEKAFSAL